MSGYVVKHWQGKFGNGAGLMSDFIGQLFVPRFMSDL